MKFQFQLQFIEKIATQLLQRGLPVDLPYHNYQHTLEVVEAVAEIGKASGLSEAEVQLVQIAAWLHDLGHTRTYTGHESESQMIALELLCAIQFPEKEIALILGCIEATRMPQKPKNKLEEVMCDADLAHLAKPHYFERSALLRREWAQIFDKQCCDHDWMEENYHFLQNHQYFTSYGQTVLTEGKFRNLGKLEIAVGMVA